MKQDTNIEAVGTKPQLVFTVVSGLQGRIILNHSIPEETLWQQLIWLGYEEKDIKAILDYGILLQEGEELEITFNEDVVITTQTEEQKWWAPYHKGNKVKFYPDGSFETVEVPQGRWGKLKEDIIGAFLEFDEDINVGIEGMLKV